MAAQTRGARISTAESIPDLGAVLGRIESQIAAVLEILRRSSERVDDRVRVADPETVPRDALRRAP